MQIYNKTNDIFSKRNRNLFIYFLGQLLRTLAILMLTLKFLLLFRLHLLEDNIIEAFFLQILGEAFG